MSLNLSTERALIRASGGSRRHLVIRWQAPVLAQPERRPPVRIAFALDRSGSMQGDKLRLAKEATVASLEMLEERDVFSIVTFDSEVECICPARAATPENRALAVAALQGVQARNQTNLFRGFLVACETIAEALPAGHLARCLLLTDGQANVEETEPVALAGLAGGLRERGIGLTTFGVGADFNEHLLRGMADAGGGNFYYVETASQISGFVRRELSDVLLISQRGARLEIRLPTNAPAELIGPQAVKLTPFGIRVELGDLVSGEIIEVVVQLRFPSGLHGQEAKAAVRVADNDGERSREIGLTWEYAGGTANDAQARVIEADRLIAIRHADRARAAALQLNRKNRFEDAARAITAVMRHLKHYAGGDTELCALLDELERDARRFAMGMSEVDHKRTMMTTSSRLRSKDTSGSARRGE